MENQTSFTPPRHWIGPEELSEGYWNDEKVLEKRGQEFHDKPVETIEMIERLDNQGLARRDFLTIMGASMAMAGFACARRPVHKIIPYVVQPEEIVPGVANYYASACPDTGYGLLIKTREGRPIKLEGNPEHPFNRGRLHSRGQAAVLDLYDPDRLKEPVHRARTSGGRKTVTWAEADAAIQGKLKGARVRILSRPLLGEASRRVTREFLSSFGDGRLVEFDVTSMDEVHDAQALSYGTGVFPRYQFDRAELILSLGADFLGTWKGSVGYAADWVKARKLDGKKASQATLSRMVAFEPTMTVTGANADERYAVRPGDELKVALAIAHELILVQKRTRYAGDSSVESILSGYKPQAVASEIGLEKGAEKIREIASKLWDARGRSLVVGGSMASKTKDAVSLQVAVNFLNSALENEGATVDGTLSPWTAAQSGFAGLEKLIAEMKAGQVDVLILHRVNPAFMLPKSAGFEDALKRVGMVVAIADREDETAALADYVLPVHHFLENWGDSHALRGVHSLQQPAIAPIHSTRGFEESLLVWSKKGESWHAYLMRHWRETIYREAGVGAPFEQFWESVLREGVLDLNAAKGGQGRPGARSFRVDSLAKLPRYQATPLSDDQVVLALSESMQLGDGAQANNPWLQELPDPISTITWDNALAVGPALAKKLGLETNHVVAVTAGDLTIQLPVYIQPGMHSQAVSVPVGWGRRSAGKVAQEAGTDVYPFAQVAGGRLVFAGMPVTLKKLGRSFRLAMTQWHHATENRPIVNDITLAEFRKNPEAANHTDPHLRMDEVPSIWPRHEFKGHRWGMAIDLNSCIGCGACVTACQAENNIPTVGRNNVRVSREMHWIRIDRYYSGPAENPDVVFQPMLCQHCENAPCETVCPVLATVHDDEGLNAQVYNRCVGTRYCQNNCPYKVRRFNFFDHWKQYTGPMNLAWNPDVTVRSRGIMEKCTFCVQRIRSQKNDAVVAGRKMGGDEVKTACQQTCPTDAIVFGDINDPSSRVSRLQGDARAFRALEVLNTRPVVSYMTKVRNKEATGASLGHEHQPEHQKKQKEPSHVGSA